MDSEAAPAGRTAAKGSRTGPNTFTTRPSGRFRLSRTSAPREGANSDRTRTVPSWAMFSTTPSRLMPPLVRPLAMRAYYLTRAEFICTGTGARARRNDPASGRPGLVSSIRVSLTLFKVDFAYGFARPPGPRFGPPRSRPERINRAPPMPRREQRETRPVRNEAMAVDLGEHRRFQPVGERGPAHPAPRVAGRRSGDRAVPRLSARVLARERHTGAPNEDRGDVPRRQPEPGPGDERFVRGEPARDVAPRRTGGRSRRHAAELHGELGPRADVRREREAAPPSGGPELAVRSGRAELPRDGEDEGHCDLQSEQSDRRGHGRGAAQGGVGRGPRPWGLATLRRSVHRCGARGAADRERVGRA